MKEKKVPWWLRKRDESPVEGVEGGASPAPVIMKDGNSISLISRGITDLLIRHLVPNTLPGTEAIGLCSPSEHGDMNLTVYLYDIKENEEMREPGMVFYDASHLQQPPMYLNLYYMITAFSEGGVHYRQEEEQRILGKVMQVLYDNPVLDSETLQPTESAAEFDFRILYQNMSMEEKTKIWNQAGMPYKLSLFYMVAPVALNSSHKMEISRVKEIRIDYEMQER